jgi:glycosyltransferase involved in cell wall biosynthesis
MSRKPLVSIVLPVHNGERFLGESIQSCLTQSYSAIELIVVDDASNDDSVNIVKSFHDERIRLVCHTVNKKLPAALNTGFAQSSGAYLTWTSDDNYYVPTAIAEMMRFFEENPQIDFVFANQYDVDLSGRLIEEVKPGPFEKLTQWCCASGCFLYRRTVYEKLGDYDETFPLTQDYDYWLRAYRHFNLGHLDRFLYYSRVHPGQMTNRFNTELIEETLALKRKVLGTGSQQVRRQLCRDHLHSALGLLQKNQRSAAARAFLRGVAFRPACLTEYNVLGLLARLCCGKAGFSLLRRAKRAILADQS